MLLLQRAAQQLIVCYVYDTLFALSSLKGQPALAADLEHSMSLDLGSSSL